MDRAPVVVGVDGSEPSITALRWAATEAWLRDVDLDVLTAYHWRTPGVTTGEQARREAERSATAIVDTAVAEARTIIPRGAVRGAAIAGSPAPALLAAARDAGLVVVGNRGRGGFRSLLLGSVSVQVATHAPTAVVVVRGRGNRAVGPILVGFDGSPAAETALAVAFEEAAVRRRGTVVVLTTYQPPLTPWTVGPPTIMFDDEVYEGAVRRELTRQVARWREKYPGVTVDCAVARGSAAGVLVDRSRHAQLTIVGTRGRGGFSGLLLGSVGLQLMHHTDCPVLIARAHQPCPETGPTTDVDRAKEAHDGDPTEPGGTGTQHRQEGPPAPHSVPARGR